MLSDLRRAVRFLSILPVGVGTDEAARPLGYAFTYFPLIGLLFGGIGALLMSLPLFDAPTRAFLVLLSWCVLSGGLHLDGFADSCDGLLATTTPERRLEIMRDPRVGTWAVVGVVLLLLGKWLLLRDLPPLWIVLPPVLGRVAMVGLAAGYPSARPQGLGAAFRSGLGRDQLIGASLIGAAVLLGVALSDWRATLGALSLPVVIFLFGRFAAGRLGGGLTGDTYGAGCELTEGVCLLLLNLW